MNWLYSKWWKWLCVVILLYVVIGSFMVPLAPGISGVQPITFVPDSLYTFHVSGYNAHFKNPKAGKVQLWFKSGNEFYCPQSIQILNDNSIAATFGVSSAQLDSLQKKNIDIVVNDDMDGTFALREGITLIDMRHRDSSSAVSAIACGHPVTTDKRQFLAFPYREILYETIRNTFFHVPMWFVMTVMVLFSLVFSITFLWKGDMKYDLYAHSAVVIAIVFGACGYTTGMVWSKYTWFIGMSWGAAIKNMTAQDIKLAGALISIAVYVAYIVVRSSVNDKTKRARVSAFFNVFAVVIFMYFVFVLPRMTDSLHPGNGGNPAFSKYDLDSTLRMFFYPAVIGWILLGLWMLSVLIRMQLIQHKQEL